jgi:hypothetical protein
MSVAWDRLTRRWTWSLLGICSRSGPQQVFRDPPGCDDLDWERGKAWAFEQAMGAVWYYADSNMAMNRRGPAHPGTHPGRHTVNPGLLTT